MEGTFVEKHVSFVVRLTYFVLHVGVMILVLISGTGQAYAADGGASGTFNRPKYQGLRQNEDWSGLAGRDKSTTGDWLDSIKYVSLSDDGQIWASFGGQIRLRYESWNNFGFAKPNDDDFLLTRIRLHSDLHFGQYLRVFIEGKSALSTERDLPGGRRTLEEDDLDLQQGFVDLTLPFGDKSTFTVRGGRQMLLFGKQRLVSPLDWSNTMRSWDGASAILQNESCKVTGFWTQFVPVRKYEFNENDSDEQFYGIYATGKTPLDGMKVDLYYLGRERDVIDEQRHTVGGRVFGKIGDSGFDYDFEGAYQFGDLGSLDIDAFMIGSQFGYNFANSPITPRLWIGFDYGSGDEDSTDGDSNTFSQLYPLGHAYLGYIDAVGRQNIIDLNAGLSIKPIDKLTASIAGHLFWRADDNDSLYNAGGAVSRAGSLGSSDEVGSEIDLLLKYKFDRHLTGILGYSHFFAGDFIEESGASEDTDFVYAGLQYTF